MMTQNHARRFFSGLILLVIVLATGFSFANRLIPTFGSTPGEQAKTLPGDEIFTRPVTEWRHAITINAAPETVWPWLVQMGDTRGGFYSYRYIEKATMLLFGGSPSLYYNNANRIHPEWQSPSAGDGMIMDTLVLRDYQAYRYLVAGPKPEASDGGLLWTWYIEPTGDGRTRLLVHMTVQIPGAQGNRIIDTGMNLATFMMERKMMEGIKLRAEGGSEADWVQVAEALAWFATLAVGIAAARRFLVQPDWRLPLGIGLTSVITLFVLVYLQPGFWLRILIDLALFGALLWRRGEEEMEARAEFSTLAS